MMRLERIPAATAKTALRAGASLKEEAGAGMRVEPFYGGLLKECAMAGIPRLISTTRMKMTVVLDGSDSIGWAGCAEKSQRSVSFRLRQNIRGLTMPLPLF